MEFINLENNESELNNILTSEVIYSKGTNVAINTKSIPIIDYKLETIDKFSSSSSSKKIIDLIQSQSLEQAFPNTIQEVIEPSETLYDYEENTDEKNHKEATGVKTPEHLKNKSGGFEQISPKKYFNAESLIQENLQQVKFPQKPPENNTMKRTKNYQNVVDQGFFEKPNKIIHIAMDNNKKGKIFYYKDMQKTNQSIWEFFQQFNIKEKLKQNIIYKHILKEIEACKDLPQIYQSIKTNAVKNNQSFNQALKDEKNVINCNTKEANQINSLSSINKEDLNTKPPPTKEKKSEPEEIKPQNNFFYKNKYKPDINTKETSIINSNTNLKVFKDKLQSTKANTNNVSSRILTPGVLSKKLSKANSNNTSNERIAKDKFFLNASKTTTGWMNSSITKDSKRSSNRNLVNKTTEENSPKPYSKTSNLHQQIKSNDLKNQLISPVNNNSEIKNLFQSNSTYSKILEKQTTPVKSKSRPRVFLPERKSLQQSIKTNIELARSRNDSSDNNLDTKLGNSYICKNDSYTKILEKNISINKKSKLNTRALWQQRITKQTKKDNSLREETESKSFNFQNKTTRLKESKSTEKNNSEKQNLSYFYSINCRKLTNPNNATKDNCIFNNSKIIENISPSKAKEKPKPSLRYTDFKKIFNRSNVVDNKKKSLMNSTNISKIFIKEKSPTINKNKEKTSAHNFFSKSKYSESLNSKISTSKSKAITTSFKKTLNPDTSNVDSILIPDITPVKSLLNTKITNYKSLTDNIIIENEVETTSRNNFIEENSNKKELKQGIQIEEHEYSLNLAKSAKEINSEEQIRFSHSPHKNYFSPKFDSISSYRNSNTSLNKKVEDQNRKNLLIPNSRSFFSKLKNLENVTKNNNTVSVESHQLQINLLDQDLNMLKDIFDRLGNYSTTRDYISPTKICFDYLNDNILDCQETIIIKIFSLGEDSNKVDFKSFCKLVTIDKSIYTNLLEVYKKSPPLKIKTSSNNTKKTSPRDKVIDYCIYKKTTDSVDCKQLINEIMESQTTFNSKSSGCV